MRPVYSIIIPHFNIPDLLVRCLQSIPVREDIQVIVVDDCSPDADTYKTRFPEFSRPYLEWYTTPKGGSAGRARNVGLDYAKGKWILFADADDFFTGNLMNILEKHKESNADVIHFKQDGRDCYTLMPADRHIDRNNSIDAFFAGNVSAIDAALWHTIVCCQMIKKKLIDEYAIRCDETVVSNDVMFSAKLTCLSEKIEFSNDILYVITSRENSLHDSKKRNPNRFIIQQQVELNFHRYISHFGVKKVPPCMLKKVHEAYCLWGVNAAWQIFYMLLKNNALFFGLSEYIKRHL